MLAAVKQRYYLSSKIHHAASYLNPHSGVCYGQQVRDPDLLHIDTNAMGALETIKFLQEEVQMLSVKARSYASYQERFGSSLSHSKRGLIGE